MKSIQPRRFVFSVCVLMLASLACSQAAGQPATSAPAIESTTVTETSSGLGELVFEDQFADNSNNWPVGKNEYAEAVIENGEFQIRVTTDGYNWYQSPVAVSDADITVDTEFVEGRAAGSDYGILCRLIDDKNHYRFKIASDGVYRIDKQVNGEYSNILDWTASKAITTGPGKVNTMRAICKGDHLSLYVNDTLLADVTDSSLEGGSFALMAGAYVDADKQLTPAVVNFSNLIVRRPAP